MPPWQSNSIEIGLAAIYETSVEAIGFAAAGIVSYLFVPPLAIPLGGTGLGLFLGRVVIKLLDHYDIRLLMRMTKEVCKINNLYPKLQLTIFTAVLVVSLFFKTLGFFAAIALGAYSALILDVENYKLIQHANRKKTQ